MLFVKEVFFFISSASVRSDCLINIDSNKNKIMIIVYFSPFTRFCSFMTCSTLIRFDSEKRVLV